ncbi:hypothetical protein [Vreelandella sp. EE24]
MKLQNLDELLTVETDNGVLFKICLGVALFFTGSQQNEKRQAVLDILADYRDLVGDQLTWTTNPTTGRWKKLIMGLIAMWPPLTGCLATAPASGSLSTMVVIGVAMLIRMK